jgi:hypothetical protein
MKDNNGSTINVSDGLPYKFTNIFKEPLNVTPKSKIEVVQADLRVNDLHEVNTQNDNNNFSYCFGFNGATIGSQRFLQKLARIPDGKYTNEQMATKITSEVKKTNLLDGFNIDVSYNDDTAFTIKADVEYDKATEEQDKNVYGLINSKMGFQETQSQQDTGIGTFAEEITIESQNDLAFPNTVTTNSSLSFLTSTTQTNDNKPSNLLSNMITPTQNGINNAGGTVSTIFKPIKHLVFPDNYQTPTTGTTFSSVIGANTTNNIVIEAEGGGHNLDFKFTAGATTYHCKFVQSKTEWDTYVLPNAIKNENLPWGHFMIINTSNQNVNTTLVSNYCTLLLDTNDYKWKLWNAGTSGLTTFDFFSTTNPAFVKTTATLTSLGNWGSGTLGLSRGECAIVGTNQVNNTNRFTRSRVYNTSPASGAVDTETEKLVYADYYVDFTPTRDGTDNYIRMNYGTQETGKVAGDDNWLTLTKQPYSDDIKLKTLLPALTDNDNILVVASVTSWLCVKYYVAHDTAGNQQFINMTMIGNTDTNNVPSTAIALPNLFNEGSFPIMPLIATNNGYVKNEQKTLTIGQYSVKSISTHSIAKLNEYMNTNWGSNETIPARQPKTTITNYCSALELTNRDVTIQSGTFSNIANTTFTIPDGIVREGFPIKPGQDSNFVMRLSNFVSTDDEYKILTDKAYSIEPNRVSKLYQSLGMDTLLFIDENEPRADGLEFKSTSLPLSNSSQNFIVNLENMGKIVGQNSCTKSVNKAIAVISASSLVDDDFLGLKSYNAPYPLPIDINAVTTEKVNNFEIYITNDEGKPADNLSHPTTLLCRITE